MLLDFNKRNLIDNITGMNEITKEDWVSPVNFNKSFKKERLVYKITGWFIFHTILDYSLTLAVFGGASIVVMINPDSTPLMIMGCVLIDIWMVANFALRDRFVKIIGKNINIDKVVMLEVLKTNYPKIDFEETEYNVIRGIQFSGRPIWGKVITVLFDDEVIYFNLTKTGKSESPTVIHGLFSYLRSRKIAKQFKTELEIA